MKNLFKIFFIPAVLIAVQSVAAYETQWNDPAFSQDKVDDTKGGQPSGNSLFKMDGEIWAGYDMYEPQDSVGTPPTPGNDNTGFHIGRAYINARGDVKEGDFKGWGYRVTVDAARANSELGTTTTGSFKNNDYNVFLKFAYINIPVAYGGKTSLRLGQQQTPTVDGQAGVSLQSIWGYRFLDAQGKQAWDDFGLSESSDLGLGLIHKSDYFGVHLLVANGEGFHKSNAQGLTSITPWKTGTDIQTQLSTLSSGSTSSTTPPTSYGLDFYGMLSIIPTGANKDVQWSINLPFREQNFSGIQNNEVETVGVDASNINSPTFDYYHGDKRAKKDQTYGLETDLTIRTQGLGFTVGAGTAVKRDLYGTAYHVDSALVNNFGTMTTQQRLANSGDYIKQDTDHKGIANYVFAHVHVGKVGVFGRYAVGTGTATSSSDAPDGKMGTASNKPWINRIIETDGTDGTFGNMTYYQLTTTVNDQAKFKTVLYGVSYQPHERFIIALGSRMRTGNAADGRELRANTLQRIATNNATNPTLDKQVFANTSVKTNLGYAANDRIVPNDWIGVKNVVREVFIRASYAF